MQSKIKPIEFLWYALYAFAALGMEIVLITFIEPIVFGGVKSSDYRATHKIIHWLLTSAVWYGYSYYLVINAKKNLDFNIFAYNDKPKRKNLYISAVLAVTCVAFNFLDWGNTFKIVGEFNKKGILLFIFQYIYYIFEILPVVLIIAFGQKFSESFSPKFRNLPWGGIVLGLTWGLVHTLSKSSLYTGLVLMVYSIIFGYIYLLTEKNIKYAYVFILLGFAV